MNRELIENIIRNVSKPARYTGNEKNTIIKENVDVKVALIYPDTYELGMSNFAIQILYFLINSMDFAAAERAFAPEQDLEEILRKENIPLWSLETYTPLNEFDIIGFTLPYELHATNILDILDLGNIPVFSKDRPADSPIIIGGGAICSNPEPLADFFDLFFIGEAEEKLPDFLNLYHTLKNRKSRPEIMKELSKMECIYNPSNWKIGYEKNGIINSIKKTSAKIISPKKAVINNINKMFIPDKEIIPFISTVHKRAVIEISRGCLSNCRFCQAGYNSRPLRERGPELIINISKKLIENSGYDQINLLSLNVNQYNNLEYLILRMANEFYSKNISITLPSLRIEKFNMDMLHVLKQLRKTGLTFALETCSDDIKQMINKNIDNNLIIDLLKNIAPLGWRHLKIYIMLGLGDDNEIETLDNFIDILKTTIKQLKKELKKGFNINLHISPFIPKPNTPLQFMGMEKIDTLKTKLNHIREKTKHTNIKFKFQPLDMSIIEAVITRGDRRLSKVIYNVWKSGAKQEAWTDKFNLETWKTAINKAGLSIDFYAHRNIDVNETLPWEHINFGITKEYLIEEYKKSAAKKSTPDCIDNPCYNCGICDKSIKPDIISKMPLPKIDIKPININNELKVAITFSKTGLIKYISHLNLIDLFARTILMTGIPAAFSKGYSPKPLLRIAAPLSLGVEGLNEIAEIQLYKHISANSIIELMNSKFPPGIHIKDAHYVEKNKKIKPEKELLKLEYNNEFDKTSISEFLLKTEEFKIRSINFKNSVVKIEKDINNARSIVKITNELNTKFQIGFPEITRIKLI